MARAALPRSDSFRSWSREALEGAEQATTSPSWAAVQDDRLDTHTLDAICQDVDGVSHERRLVRRKRVACWRARDVPRVNRPVVCSLLVMVASLEDDEILFEHLVDEAVFLGDTARPSTSNPVLQRLRLADPARRIAQCVVEQTVDALDDGAVSPLPVRIVLPPLRGEDQPHSR